MKRFVIFYFCVFSLSVLSGQDNNVFINCQGAGVLLPQYNCSENNGSIMWGSTPNDPNLNVNDSYPTVNPTETTIYTVIENGVPVETYT